MFEQSTIFGLASGSLPSAVAIIKISGPRAFEIGERVFQSSSDIRNRGMHYGNFITSEGRKFDDGLLLSFPAPNSHTGENVIELQCHGSLAVVRLLTGLIREHGGEPAQAGEFTWRAYSNGRVSAEQVDELADLFQKKEPIQLSIQKFSEHSSLTDLVGRLTEKFINLQAVLDTAVDFSEEYSSAYALSKNLISEISKECSEAIQRYSWVGSTVKSPAIVIAGCPNAGKSSLFNALLCQQRALVHREPGTTRDAIESEILIGGRTWTLVDTAGFRKADSSTEQMGMEIGRAFLGDARIWILVVDGSVGLGTEDRALLDQFGEIPHLVLWNKSDREDWKRPDEVLAPLMVSTQTGAGLSTVLSEIERIAAKIELPVAISDASGIQLKRLEKTKGSLAKLALQIDEGLPPEYASESCRQSLRDLRAICGEVTTEDILDRVFSEFCIGK